MRTDELSIVVVHPEILGTYGDRGNGLALAHRAAARGLPHRLIQVGLGDPVPAHGDIYLLGGGEDAATLLSWNRLSRDRGLAHGLTRALTGDAVALGVCAGFQMLAAEFSGSDGRPREGLGFLDVRCGRLRGGRAVGEVLARPDIPGLDFLTGYENHQGDAVLGPSVRPLGHLTRGVGNGDGRTEGAVSGHVFGTYAHGPVLVRNDGLADHLLSLVAGTLAPFVDEPVRRLRAERRRAALQRRAS